MAGKSIDFAQLESLARRNQWNEIEKKIRAADRTYFLISDVLALATLARRAYRLSFASFLLKPYVVDPESRIRKDAKEECIAEYAVVQTMLGGRTKAMDLLTRVDPKSTKFDFAWVTFHFSEQQYDKAIPYLRRSMSQGKDEYKQKVSELNLCACLTYCGQWLEAEHRARQLERYFSQSDYKLLAANTKELLGQIYIHTNQWQAARKILTEARQLMIGNNKLYSLFIDKWLLVCEIKTGRASKTEVMEFIARAEDLNHFHSVREILFYWGLLNNDLLLLEKIYFSTPYQSYREMIESRTGISFNLPSCDWNGQFFSHSSQQVMDLTRSPFKGINFSNQEFILLKALCENILEPQSISSLFYNVYPEEYFDPEYSPAKTYKVLQRLRTKLSSLSPSLPIENLNGKYRLQPHPEMAIRLVNPQNHQGLESINLLQLASRYQDRPFSRTEVMESFNLKKSTAVRLLKNLQQDKKIIKLGQGPASCYQIAS